MSSLRRGHANLLCIVPILTDDPRRESENTEHKSRWTTGTQLRKTPSQPKLRRFPGSFPEIFYTRKLPRHRLGQLYTVWAGCTQSGPTVYSRPRLYTSGSHRCVQSGATHLAQVPMGTSQVSMETSQVSMETSQVPMETSQVPMRTSQVRMTALNLVKYQRI